MAILNDFDYLDLIKATTTGRCGFLLRGSEEPLRRCIVCDATFPQDHDGTEALKQHEYDAHSMASLTDVHALHELTLRIIVRPAKSQAYPTSFKYFDVYGVDDITGTLYHLTHLSDSETRIWKWKLTHDDNGQSNMPNVLALLSIGSSGTDEK